ncbi:uncharacterized mitochondrial protein AtMg00820-like [Lotus japonicus]|uniref:uncharacterized mitochondrial protein AtMg00820-like n=1 Tax=Lotus japonicus TaxID=34305 RepID=UPI0025896268|nr:uncharacterized mitochondrial protein AtMg00820-like [Lotus japonicus]
MVTRSKNNIFKPKRALTTFNHPLPENLEPSNIREAMCHEHWRRAVSDEFDALLRNGTWSLVPPPKGKNILGCKGLFRIKRNTDSTIARYKARLVAKGFTQCAGPDYKETFAPVVRPQTIKIVLTLSLTHRWPMRQLDVNNAFLQGALQEQVFMASRIHNILIMFVFFTKPFMAYDKHIVHDMMLLRNSSCHKAFK